MGNGKYVCLRLTIMAKISNILRSVAGNGLSFWCPGCETLHQINVGIGTGPRWGWNNSVDKPTFTPSILVTYPAVPDAEEDFKEWRTARVCHSFVTDGNIQFLSDCTHSLAGQTIPIPTLPKWLQ